MVRSKREPPPSDGQHCAARQCDRPARVGGYCNAHYNRLTRTGSTMEDRPINARKRRCWKYPPNGECSAIECERPLYSRFLCEPHYRRLIRRNRRLINRRAEEGEAQ